MRRSLSPTTVVLGSLLAVVLTLGCAGNAQAFPIGIGFGDVAVLAIGVSDVGSSGTQVIGGLGITTPGKLANPSGSLTIQGDLYIDQASGQSVASLQTMAHLTVTGSIFEDAATDTLLNGWATTAEALSSADKLLATNVAGAPTFVIAQDKTINGVAGVNVVNLTNLILTGNTLTLYAPCGGSFVVNDSGAFIFNGAIALTGCLTPGDVVFNTWAGPSATFVSGYFNGILLNPYGAVSFGGSGMAVGEIIGAGPGELDLSGGWTIDDCAPGAVCTPAVPEPTSLLLLGTGVLGLTGLYRRRMRRQ